MFVKPINAMAKHDEIRIYGVSPKLKTDLYNIAKNTGVTLASLLKPKLREIAESYPTQMKQEVKD
jgi:hypothetical protein